MPNRGFSKHPTTSTPRIGLSQRTSQARLPVPYKTSSSGLSNPIKEVERWRKWQKTQTTTSRTHIFSNSSPCVHYLLPLLFSNSDTVTRIQLRCTCRLFRRVYQSWVCANLKITDLRFDPLHPKVVLVGDWNALFEHGRLVPKRVWRFAKSSDLALPLKGLCKLSILFYARPPCISESMWSERLYRNPSEKYPHFALYSSHGVPDSTFGRVDKEFWTTGSKTRFFTVDEISAICVHRYGAWHQHEQELTLASSFQRSMPIRYDQLLRSYVLDALQTPGWPLY